MNTPFDRIMARRRGVEPEQATPETEPFKVPETQPTVDLPLPLRMLLSKMGVDPNAIAGHLKHAEEMVVQNVADINSKLNIIVEAQARQMGMLDRYNDTLIAVLQRLTEVESNQKQTPMNEFGEMMFDDANFNAETASNNIDAVRNTFAGVAGGIEIIDAVQAPVE